MKIKPEIKVPERKKKTILDLNKEECFVFDIPDESLTMEYCYFENELVKQDLTINVQRGDVFITLKKYDKHRDYDYVEFMNLSSFDTFRVYDCETYYVKPRCKNILDVEIKICKPCVRTLEKTMCYIEDIRKNDAFTVYNDSLSDVKTTGVYVCFDDGFQENDANEKFCRTVKCIDITDMSIHEFSAGGAIKCCHKVFKLTDIPDQKILFKF